LGGAGRANALRRPEPGQRVSHRACRSCEPALSIRGRRRKSSYSSRPTTPLARSAGRQPVPPQCDCPNGKANPNNGTRFVGLQQGTLGLAATRRQRWTRPEARATRLQRQAPVPARRGSSHGRRDLPDAASRSRTPREPPERHRSAVGQAASRASCNVAAPATLSCDGVRFRRLHHSP
jgi:hypothetical protein